MLLLISGEGIFLCYFWVFFSSPPIYRRVCLGAWPPLRAEKMPMRETPRDGPDLVGGAAGTRSLLSYGGRKETGESDFGPAHYTSTGPGTQPRRMGATIDSSLVTGSPQRLICEPPARRPVLHRRRALLPHLVIQWQRWS